MLRVLRFRGDKDGNVAVARNAIGSAKLVIRRTATVNPVFIVLPHTVRR